MKKFKCKNLIIIALVISISVCSVPTKAYAWVACKEAPKSYKTYYRYKLWYEGNKCYAKVTSKSSKKNDTTPIASKVSTSLYVVVDRTGYFEVKEHQYGKSKGKTTNNFQPNCCVVIDTTNFDNMKYNLSVYSWWTLSGSKCYAEEVYSDIYKDVK